MHLLLDTHVFIWCIQGEKKLSKETRARILNATDVYISSASVWEIAIKIKLGKLNLNLKEIVDAIDKSGFSELPITVRHAATVCDLPKIHRDPFDRILIAQAICEPLIFLTADAALKNYSELVELIN